MPYSLCLYQLSHKDDVSCDVFDLEDENNTCHLLSLKVPRTLPSMHELFQQLMIDYPSTDVKFIIIDMPFINTHFGTSEWFHKLRSVGKIYGYGNLRRPSTLSKLSTSMLLCARKLRQEFSIDDIIVIMALTGTTIRIHMLRKKKLGWDVVKNFDKMFEPGEKNIEEYFKILNFDMDKITAFLINSTGNVHLEEAVKEFLPDEKTLFLITGDRTEDEKKCLILETCEYLSKVYSGDDYWMDYECFVPTICEKVFEVHVGSQVIPYNFQYKSVPCSITKDISLDYNVERIKVIASYKHSSQCTFDSKVVFDTEYSQPGRNIIFTISIDQFDQFYFRTEVNDENKTFVEKSSSNGDSPIFFPAIIIDRETVQVNYFRNGLLWSLKNAHGSRDILTAVCFTETESLIEKISLCEKDALVRSYDFGNILNECVKKHAHDYGRIQLDEDGEYKLVVKTFEGWKKIKPSELFAVYVHQLLKQLEQNMNERIVVNCLVSVPYFLNLFVGTIKEMPGLLDTIHGVKMISGTSNVSNSTANDPSISEQGSSRSFNQQNSRDVYNENDDHNEADVEIDLQNSTLPENFPKCFIVATERDDYPGDEITEADYDACEQAARMLEQLNQFEVIRNSSKGIVCSNPLLDCAYVIGNFKTKLFGHLQKHHKVFNGGDDTNFEVRSIEQNEHESLDRRSPVRINLPSGNTPNDLVEDEEAGQLSNIHPPARKRSNRPGLNTLRPAQIDLQQLKRAIEDLKREKDGFENQLFDGDGLSFNGDVFADWIEASTKLNFNMEKYNRQLQQQLL